MSLAPLRPCPHPHCGKLTRTGRCDAHRLAHERARPSAANRGYDRQWAEYSQAWLHRYPWCGQRRDGQLHAQHSRCVQQGVRTRAQVTDHIISIRDGGAVFDPTNHQSLCFSCNTRKG